MTVALLIADLEGVAGVDRVEALVAGAQGYPAACALLSAEVAAAAQALLGVGFERVRVSDSHSSGSGKPNLDPGVMPGGVELCFGGDPFGAELFEGVSAAACLGMHAAAGTRGFAAHTVGAHSAVFGGKRSLSESELFLGLCAERGVPVLFVSGCDVLAAALKGRVHTLVTKKTLSASRAASRSVERVHRLLAEAAARAPQPAPALQGALTLRFKSRWMAAQAVGEGAPAGGDCAVRLEGATLRERYERGLALIRSTGKNLRRALRQGPGQPLFGEDSVKSLLRPLSQRTPAPTAGRAARALSAFLAQTSGAEAWQKADRALTLHMLEGHAPRFFHEAHLSPALEAALAALGGLPAAFGFEVGADEAMARLDGLYLLRARGLPAASPSPDELRRYTEGVLEVRGPVWGWLFGEFSRAIGVEPPFTLPQRACRDGSRLEDLYWLTHLFLLQTGYLKKPLPPGALAVETEELLLAAPWAVEQGSADLAAELAFCLQAAGERRSAEHCDLLGLLARHQRADGSMKTSEHSARWEAHCTAAALV
ncbi:MAG: DUF6895 family protein, partial [Myxococcaceae bacterium]